MNFIHDGQPTLLSFLIRTQATYRFVPEMRIRYYLLFINLANGYILSNIMSFNLLLNLSS